MLSFAPLSRTLLVAGLLPLAACGKSDEPRESGARPVQAMRVGDTTEFLNRSYPGRAEAIEEVDRAFEVAGRLIEISGRGFLAPRSARDSCSCFLRWRKAGLGGLREATRLGVETLRSQDRT